MWSPASSTMWRGARSSTMSMFWYTASAVPRYQLCSETRWLAGSMSKLSFRSGRRKFQPRCRWRIRLCALYWVATATRRMPELMALDSAKSMMRDLPPKKTAGLARRSVSSISRLPRPPARTKAMAVRASGPSVRGRVFGIGFPQLPRGSALDRHVPDLAGILGDGAVGGEPAHAGRVQHRAPPPGAAVLPARIDAPLRVKVTVEIGANHEIVVTS